MPFIEDVFIGRFSEMHGSDSYKNGRALFLTSSNDDPMVEHYKWPTIKKATYCISDF